MASSRRASTRGSRPRFRKTSSRMMTLTKKPIFAESVAGPALTMEGSISRWLRMKAFKIRMGLDLGLTKTLK